MSQIEYKAIVYCDIEEDHKEDGKQNDSLIPRDHEASAKRNDNFIAQDHKACAKRIGIIECTKREMVVLNYITS